MKTKRILQAIAASFGYKPGAQVQMGAPEHIQPAGRRHTNIILDLETLGQQPTAAILSIGAVAFNPVTNEVSPSYYTTIDLQTCLDAGLTIDAGTFYWWMKQPDAARKAACAGTDVTWLEDDHTVIHRTTLTDALEGFAEFINTECAGEKEVRIWGNGSDFDNAILANAYRAIGQPIPWKFWNNRCYRTLKNQYRHIKLDRSGTHHNALDDAITQAEHAIRILQHKREIERKAGLIDEGKAA